MNSTEKKRIQDYLSRKLSDANIVLFTGAGLSMSAKNRDGNSLPSGKTLAKEIWQIAFPDQAFDETSTLPDVFQAARSTGENRLVDFLKRRLTVDPASLPEWYRTFYNQPWHKTYTLNIDSLLHAVGIRFDLNRPLKIFSGIGESEALAHKHEELVARHLNGTIDDLPDGVTFSDEQYGMRLASQDPVYHVLSAELLRFPFVFVGTELDESILWQHISLRKMKGKLRGLRETRPQSFLVVPTLSAARQKALSDFNITWLPMTAEQFTEEFLVPLKISSALGFQHIKQLNAAKHTGITKIPLVADLIAQDGTRQNKNSEYLLGSEPSWTDITTGRSIEREKEAEWVESLQKDIKKTSGKTPLYVVTGTAGDGKSSIAMSIATKLSAKGHRIGWIDDASNISPHEISRLCENTAPLECLVIDDADMYGSSLQHVVSDVCARRLVKVLVLGVRSSRVDRLLDTPNLDTLTWKEFATYRLTDGEINSLLDLLKKENLLGELKLKSRTEQIEVFREKEKSDRQLVVAMIEATSGMDFAKRICDEFEDLDATSRDLYCLIAVASNIRHYIRGKEILLVTDSSNEGVNRLAALTKRGLLIRHEDDTYRSRHRVIAKTVADRLATDGALLEYYTKLSYLAALSLMTEFDFEGRLKRLLKFTLNHATLLQITDLNRAREHYSAIEELQVNNHHFWLQRGSLELENGSISHAQNYLAQARVLNDEDPYVKLACAHLDFKQVNTNPKSEGAAEAMEDAFKTLMELIESRGAKDAYPYHVLGSQGLVWCRRAIENLNEKQKYLEKLLKIIDSGVNHHRREDMLLGLQETLKRELLTLAIPR